MRIVLTGTPVENRLSDLWSLFDFVCPGLLGTQAKFKEFTKKLNERQEHRYAPLRSLVKPYILRRMKTDRRIIDDLPEKVEVRAFCGLTKRQAALYAKLVKELSDLLDDVDGMKRRKLVLAYLMRFKQLCNHPSQLLGDGLYGAEDSGKFVRLAELCGEIGSLLELLQGKLSDHVMEVVTDQKEGLFPLPGEMSFRCSCPDWASMCKHVAAVLYGIGARLDTKPELLFALRGVNHEELIEADAAQAMAAATSRGKSKRLAAEDLGEVFGIELGTENAVEPQSSPTATRRTKAAKTAAKPTAAKPTAAKKKPPVNAPAKETTRKTRRVDRPAAAAPSKPTGRARVQAAPAKGKGWEVLTQGENHKTQPLSRIPDSTGPAQAVPSTGRVAVRCDDCDTMASSCPSYSPAPRCAAIA